MSAPSPYRDKNPNLLKSWAIRKGQLLTQYTMFLSLHHHLMAKKSKNAKVLEHQKESTFGWVYNIFTSAPPPYDEKYPNLLTSWGMERINFWLSVQCFGIFTITPMAKNIQICWILGAWKGSTFSSVYKVLASSLLPPRGKISKFAEIFGH